MCNCFKHQKCFIFIICLCFRLICPTLSSEIRKPGPSPATVRPQNRITLDWNKKVHECVCVCMQRVCMVLLFSGCIYIHGGYSCFYDNSFFICLPGNYRTVVISDTMVLPASYTIIRSQSVVPCKQLNHLTPYTK